MLVSKRRFAYRQSSPHTVGSWWRSQQLLLLTRWTSWARRTIASRFFSRRRICKLCLLQLCQADQASAMRLLQSWKNTSQALFPCSTQCSVSASSKTWAWSPPGTGVYFQIDLKDRYRGLCPKTAWDWGPLRGPELPVSWNTSMVPFTAIVKHLLGVWSLDLDPIALQRLCTMTNLEWCGGLLIAWLTS